ncbi:MAG: BON domain-containing protein [Acidobacteriota bacterium]
MKTKLTPLLSTLVITISLLIGCETQNVKLQNANAPDPAKTGNANNGDWNISREAFERQKDRLAKEARELGRKIGDGNDDLWIWTKTRGALAYADGLRGVTINVDVENAVITLSGRLPNEAQKTQAEEIARNIDGVKSVKNDLIVSANLHTG